MVLDSGLLVGLTAGFSVGITVGLAVGITAGLIFGLIVDRSFVIFCRRCCSRPSCCSLFSSLCFFFSI